MSSARKCDRCGRCFDPLGQGLCVMAQFKNPVFASSKDIHEHSVGYYLIDDSVESWVDLCPNCTKDFEAFMEGNPLSLRDFDFDRPDIDDANRGT